jgi:hypothetical protein
MRAVQKVDLPAPAGPWGGQFQVANKGFSGRYHHQGAVLAHCRGRDRLITRVMRLDETLSRPQRDTFLPSRRWRACGEGVGLVGGGLVVPRGTMAC